MRETDWSGTLLGPADEWPEALKAAVATVLSSPQPMFMAWGPELVSFFNDAYRPILGVKVDGALGKPFADLWSDVWTDIEPIVAKALGGEGSMFRDMPLLMSRNGYPEETWWSFSYSPLRDGSGAVRGMLCVTTETTEGVKAERELRTSEARQRLVLQQMPGFVGVLAGPDHVYEYVNDAYIAISGRRDFIGRSVREVFPELAGQGFYELLDEVYASGKRFEARALPIRLVGDQADRYIDLLYQPIGNPTGAVTGIFVGGYDVTEQVRSQTALTENEIRYRTLFESIDVGFCIIEMKFDGAGRAVDYRIAEANPAFERQTGARVAGLWVSEFAPNLERHWFDTYGHVALTGEPAHFENRADVFGRWFDVRALRIGDPAAHRVAIFFSDITERKSMEDALRTMNAALESRVEERTQERDRIWQLSGDMLGVADDRGVWLAVNPAWSRTLGWQADEIVGRTSEWMEHRDDIAKTRAEVGRLAAGQTTFQFENRFRTKSGEYCTLSWTAVPEDGLLYCTARDVTEQRKQAEALAAAEEALRQSQKMEAVGQLTGGLAHDFNNLLAGISGSLDMMQARIGQGRFGDLDRYMTGAQGAAKRAAALTHRLLAFSRRQTLEPKPTDVDRLVAGMEDMVRRTVGPEIAVEFHGLADLWSTLVDPNQLENALLNLCINARDALPDGGRIAIETGNRTVDDRSAAGRDMPPGDYVTLAVSDNGVGMLPEVVERVFEPFFTTKPIGVGTGLGLSMIYGFAKQSGGQVRIHSLVGKGTTVTIFLPRYAGAEVAEAVVSSDAEDRQAKIGETVLVIDDEPLVRMLVVDVLEDLGYRAMEAGDGPEGLKIIKSDVRIDLLITDVGLPKGMNGRQVADAARELRPGLKVLFVTGYAETAVLSHGHLELGMAVVTKPFQMDALAKRIQEMIGGA